jgi:hypothetical protein
MPVRTPITQPIHPRELTILHRAISETAVAVGQRRGQGDEVARCGIEIRGLPRQLIPAEYRAGTQKVSVNRMDRQASPR